MDRAHGLRILSALLKAQGDFYAGGPAEPLQALLATDIHWHVPGHNAIDGDYVGRDEVMKYFAVRRDLADRTFRIHPGDVLVGSGHYLASLNDGTATIGGVVHRWSTVGLYRLRDDQIAACWLLALDQAQFDAVWRAR